MKITNLTELIGRRVVVTADAGTAWYMVAERHLQARRLAAIGVVKGWVPGHCGDVVYIEQEDTPPTEEAVAVYCHLTELELYSEAALTFARDKAAKVIVAERELRVMKEQLFAESHA